MFAVGVFGGLRKAEILALQWNDIRLDRRTIKVCRQKVHGKNEIGPLKDDETRIVPINDTLLGILRAWKLRAGKRLWVFPSVRGTMTDNHTPNAHLDAAFEGLADIERVTWYQATRHTYASHYVMDGGSIERLAKILGHSSTYVTERYAHLRPDVFDHRDYGAACVDLSEGSVIELGTKRAQSSGQPEDRQSKVAK